MDAEPGTACEDPRRFACSPASKRAAGGALALPEALDFRRESRTPTACQARVSDRKGAGRPKAARPLGLAAADRVGPRQTSVRLSGP